MRKKTYTEAVTTATACAVVGLLAAIGTFNSIMNFPIVFAGIMLGIGLLSIWRKRPREKTLAKAAILVLGALLAVGGWAYQRQVVELSRTDARLSVLESIHNTVVPSPTGLQPLNTDQATWDHAASFGGKATIVTFWARWCSPCWKEMEELELLYRQHGPRGLSVVAVTRYDTPDDGEERQSDFDKAQRFLEGRDLTYPAAITDRDDLYRAYRVRSPPGTALIDEQGRVVDFAISLESARALMEKAATMVDGGTG